MAARRANQEFSKFISDGFATHWSVFGLNEGQEGLLF
jgi:hypothetical protein